VIYDTTEADAKRVELALRRQYSQEVMPHDPKVVDVWPDWLKWYARDHAAGTVTDIGYAALKLLDHFGQWHLSRLTLPLFEKYLDMRHATLWSPPKSKAIPKPVSKSRINTEIKYFRQFLSYCVEKRYMIKLPFDIPRFKKLPKRIANLPSIPEVDLLLSKCNDDCRLAVLLYHDAGLRRKEGLNIKSEDVFLDDGKIRVIGKGNKERFAVIATERLAEELEARIKKTGPGLLMKNSRTGAAYEDLTKGIKAASERAGISKTIFNHLFRGVHASRLHDAGVPIADIQEQLGHEDIDTTRKYITVTLGKRIESVKRLDGYLTDENVRLRNVEAKKHNKAVKKAP
jgi:integrase/recombinase XerD